MSNAYDEAYRRSLEDPEGFWGEIAEDVCWYKKWDKVLDDSNKPFYRWFEGPSHAKCSKTERQGSTSRAISTSRRTTSRGWDT